MKKNLKTLTVIALSLIAASAYAQSVDYLKEGTYSQPSGASFNVKTNQTDQVFWVGGKACASIPVRYSYNAQITSGGNIKFYGAESQLFAEGTVSGDKRSVSLKSYNPTVLYKGKPCENLRGPDIVGPAFENRN